MQAGEIYLVFTEPLEQLGLRYMVVGSVASSSYGEPRFTHDIDLIVTLRAEDIAALCAAFPLEGFDCPPAETLLAEVERESGGHFNLVHHESGFRADVYVAADDELCAWAFENLRRVEVLPGRSLALAPPEFVVLGKLAFYAEGGGERHVRDIRAMLQVGEDELDLELLRRWIERLGLEAAWEAVGAE